VLAAKQSTFERRDGNHFAHAFATCIEDTRQKLPEEHDVPRFTRTAARWTWNNTGSQAKVELTEHYAKEMDMKANCCLIFAAFAKG